MRKCPKKTSRINQESRGLILGQPPMFYQFFKIILSQKFLIGQEIFTLFFSQPDKNPLQIIF